LLLFLAGSFLAPHASAQVKASIGPPERPASYWAAEAGKNEISIVDYNGVYLRYHAHIVNSHGDQVRDVIESRDGTVARLILKENRPLTPEEDAAEHERLQTMLDSPSAFAKHVKGDVSGKKLAADLVKLMPEAMLFDYAPGQPQRTRPATGPDAPRPGTPTEIVIDFHPNPDWKPTTMTAEALTGLQGRLWIDQRTKFVTRLEANVFRGVSLGWGMVAHINPGGTVVLEQVNIADRRWIFSHFTEHVTLRALMVKNITENSQIDSSTFSEIPSMPYQEAIKLLLATPVPH
jgi:hypothetical protein